MKLIKIGSSSSCDIVLHSEYVSGHHADLLVLDDGQVTIEDRGSTNGTFVGSGQKRINPGTPVQIRRGDLVRFGDTDLNWSLIPKAEDNSDYKRIINIGSNDRNEIKVPSDRVSRYHASLKIDNKGRAFIVDHNSKNGTKVNGSKIASDKPVRVKHGDSIVCGDTDLTSRLMKFIPNRFGWAKWAAAAAATVALIGGGIGIWKAIDGPKTPPGAGGPNTTVEEMVNSTVYVFAAYHFNITLEDNPVDAEMFQYPSPNDGPLMLQATAFFIDAEGHMATNRHVALPWNEEYRSDSIHNVLKQAVENYMVSYIPRQVVNRSQYDLLTKSPYGRELLKASKSLTDLNALVSRVYRSPIKITGEMDYIAVGYPGRYFADLDELERCNVICESGSEDIDVAILQLNNKKTPEEIQYYFPIDYINENKLEPMAEDLYTIGYPSGLVRAMDQKTKSLEPTSRTTKVSKIPSRFVFEIQDDNTGGSSGSPVFDENKQLVGILSEVYSGNGASSIVVQARYLKELYEKEELRSTKNKKK